MSKNKIIYLSAGSAILIVVLIILLAKSTNDSEQSNKKTADKILLVGEWVRTDAGYLISIASFNVDGTLEAKYFNPNPINVGSATWQENYGNLEVIVELQDVNYPGSKYTLSYLHDRDVLAGNYYQAMQGLDFYVEFARNK